MGASARVRQLWKSDISISSSGMAAMRASSSWRCLSVSFFIVVGRATLRCHPEKRSDEGSMHLTFSARCGASSPQAPWCQLSLRLEFMRAEPAGAQVGPSGIHGNNQRHLLQPRHPFDLLLATDGAGVSNALFVEDEAIEMIAVGEAVFKAPVLVLPHTATKVARRSGVEGLGAVRHDVDEGHGVRRAL